MTTVCLTGSTGFLGAALSKKLNFDGDLSVRCVVRKIPHNADGDLIEVGAIDGNTDYTIALNQVDTVIHCAARAHIMKDEVAEPLAEYRKVNVFGSENLARQAAKAGVKRFIFISSVKVCGESTTSSTEFVESEATAPEDSYGQSKDEAEQVLKKVALETGMDLVIIRPPLVYGPGVKANFLSLLKLADTMLPLPFGAINNHRSMVYVGNLVDFIILCIDHPKAANQTFLISDGEDLSLRSLITYIRQAMGKPVRLVYVPNSLFKLAGMLTGKSTVVDRLVGDLQVNSKKASQLLGWTPAYSVKQGITSTVADFSQRNS
mgnify:CR=1 FL=1